MFHFRDGTAPKKRGRPRKIPLSEEDIKPIIKTERPSLSFPLKSPMTKVEHKPFRYKDSGNSNVSNLQPPALANVENLIQAEVLKTPTGQTLKKVCIKFREIYFISFEGCHDLQYFLIQVSASVIRSLTKAVKVLPLPPKVTEMKVGPNKVVKVQRVLMTKAEVDEMAKKGLVEFKVKIIIVYELKFQLMRQIFIFKLNLGWSDGFKTWCKTSRRRKQTIILGPSTTIAPSG